ncbi:MAG: ABC transporter substrate-binding protein [Betaproteobacteria bacterium]
MRVGIITFARSTAEPNNIKSFIGALSALGWSEGRDIVYDVVYAEGDQARLPALAEKIVAGRPDVILAPSAFELAPVLKNTGSIPVVFWGVNDPVAQGYVKSLARPDGNVTGIANIGWELAGKRMQLLKEVLPKISRVGVLVTSARSSSLEQKFIEQAAGGNIKVVPAKVTPAMVKAPPDLDAALALLAENRVEAVLTTQISVFSRERRRILDFTTARGIPLIAHAASMADDGSLVAYAPVFSERIERSASIVNKLLRGAKPADIPVEQPTKFELVINLKTAKALGITIPEKLLLRADRVIE